MLADVIKVLLEKFIEVRPRKEKAEDQFKEKLVFLHEALVTCQNAYIQFLSAQDDFSFETWSTAIRRLQGLIGELSTTLAVFDPKASDAIVAYLSSEKLTIETYAIRDNHPTSSTKQATATPMTDAEKEYDEEFGAAIATLRTFIRKELKPGEVQSAKEAFSRDTYWGQINWGEQG